MRAAEVRVTSAGPALGEIISEGALMDDQEKVLATFRQRFRAGWAGLCSICGWKYLRGTVPPVIHGTLTMVLDSPGATNEQRCCAASTASVPSLLPRPETPDYVEIRIGSQSTVIFPGGLPFHQRHGGRMLDVILVPEGETARSFDLAIGLDRVSPMQTALGMVTPLPVVPVASGPPHIGASGWLFHLDAQACCSPACVLPETALVP